MRIVLFGNTNNYPLRLARALRDLGHDAQLLVDRKEPLHRPESLIATGRQAYPDWIHDVSDLTEEDYVGPSPRIGRVIQLLDGADALILNGLGPSLLAFVQRPTIAFLTGSDLDYYANYQTVANRKHGWDKEFRRSAAALLDCRLWVDFIRRQREGILRSTAVSYFHRGLAPAGDALLDEIGVDDSRRFFIYMCDTFGNVTHQPAGRRPPRIFCGSRLTWKKPIHPGGSPLDYKGSDIMIRGLAKFVEKTGKKLDIHLFEKGLHVAESKALVHELGLDAHVTWLPEVPLQQFLRAMAEADICFESLGDSCIGMVGLDAMAMGKPVIANARPEVWRRHLDEEWPVCHAVTPEDVCGQLERLLADEQYRRDVGERARRFVTKYFSPQVSARMCLEKLGIS